MLPLSARPCAIVLTWFFVPRESHCKYVPASHATSLRLLFPLPLLLPPTPTSCRTSRLRFYTSSSVFAVPGSGSSRRILLRHFWRLRQSRHAPRQPSQRRDQPRYLGRLGRLVLERRAADGVERLEDEVASGRL